MSISQQAPVYFSHEAYVSLNERINDKPYSAIFILVDEKTQNFCLSRFMQILQTEIPIEVIEIDTGEEFKNIETCNGVWKVLSELDADRFALLINLGGGVITDLGGFVASTYKRGISFINVPTTLLSMVDASIGGKTGVDLDSLKNQIGVINQPEMVLIDIEYLQTLPANEMRSGLAEILKHGLIASEDYYTKAINLSGLTLEDLDDLIKESINIKTTIVEQDENETGLRKSLNFGHTFGHAIESYFLEEKSRTKLLHGEAVVAGIILALDLSVKTTGFSSEKFQKIRNELLDIYPKNDLTEEDIPKILALLKFDKKNSHGNINFVLLKDIAKPVIDCNVDEKELIDVLKNYVNY